MKFWLRSLLGLALALGLAAAAQAQSLGVSTVTADNGVPRPGDTVLFTVTVINNDTNTGFAGGTVSIALSLTNQVTNQVVDLTPSTSVTLPAIAAGATMDVKISKSIPLRISQAGPCKATAVLTNGAVVTSFTTTAAIFTITAKPDLAITSLTYPAGTSYKGGDVIPMALTWTNFVSTAGVANVPFVPGKNGDQVFFRIEIILSSNPTFGDGDDFLLAAFDITGLQDADGINRLLNWNQLLPGNFAGSYYVMAKIDTLSGVSETVDNDLASNGNNTWFDDTNAARINLLPTNFPTDYWASSAGNGYSDNPALSTDGRYVAFASDSTNLVGTGLADTNNFRDIFLYDNQTATVRRINLSQQGAQANGASATPAISSDGRYVAYSSEATNLIVGDTNGFSDIYVTDTLTGAISLISVTDAGVQANGSNFKPSISADGRFIVFESSATNFVTGGTAVGVTHIYLHDRNVHGLNDGTTQANPVYDVAGNTSTVLIDQATGGTTANGNSLEAKISADGKVVVFASDATNLVTGDTNTVRDIFVRDLTAPATTRVSISNTNTQSDGASHAPSISADGRFIAFGSTATNLIGIGNDANGVSDIFVRDRTSGTTTRVSVSTAGAEAVDPSAAGFKLGSINPSISKDGRYVTFASLASNLTAGDGGGQTQHLTVTNGGSGYTSAPVVSFTGGGPGTGAAATAAVSGPVTGISIGNGGSGYTSIPTVLLTGGGGADATATATTNGGTITGITITNPGSGYTSAPTVSFTDGGGTGAVATATISLTVTSVTLTNMGSGYTSAPTVALTGGGGTGAAATAYLNLNGFVTGGDDNAAVDVFVVDRDVSGSGTYDVPGHIATSLVSVNRFGLQTQQLLGVPSSAASDIYPVISADGRWVALPSDAENTGGLVHGANNRTSPDLNTYRDVFLHDRRTNALPNPGNLPSVSVAAPNPVLVNTDVTVTATATTTVSGGVISSVAFYVNGTLLGTSTDFPYSVTWTPHAVGTFTLSALATDNFGNVGVSTNVTVRVNAAPGVSITSPVAGSTLSQGTGIEIDATASATTPGAHINSVQFYANGVPVGAPVTGAPFTVTWTPSSTGSFSLTALATDSNLTQSTSPAIVVNVAAVASSLPIVAITSPLDGFHGIKNVTQTITATATSATSTIDRVDFAINGTAFGTVSAYPYTLPWTPTAIGSYVITATATDHLGGHSVATSNVTIGTAPDVKFTSPIIIGSATSAQVAVNSSNSVTVTATPTGATIVSVEFRANGALLATVTSFPYTTVWTPSATGTYVLTAVATDSAGIQGSAPPRTVIVSGGNPPAVTITSPAAPNLDFAVGDTISFSAQTALGAGLISHFAWFVNGVSVHDQDVSPSGQGGGSPPFFNYPWAAVGSGDYVIVGVATDTSGNVATSAPVTVTVSGATAPTVSITSPAGSSALAVNVSQTITADASSQFAAIASVEFFANGRSLSVDTQFPYSTAWTPTGPGTYKLIAVATDNFGTQTTSAPVTVTVGSSALAVISNNGLTDIAQGSVAILRADAGPNPGTIKQAQFFEDLIAIGAPVTSSPFTLVYSPTTAAGTSHNITVQLTNNNGAALPMSDLLALKVVGAATAVPAISAVISNPLDQAKLAIPNGANAIRVSVDARSLTGGFITKVELYVEGSLLGSIATYPYNFDWTPTITGTYHLVALAYDNHNNVVATTTSTTATSTPAPTTVGIAAPPVISINTPIDGGTLAGGVQGQVAFTASSSNNYPLDIQLYQDDVYVGGATLTAGGVGSVSYVPTQKIHFDVNNNPVVDLSSLYAIATDPLGFSTKSTVIANLHITNGGSGGGTTAIGHPPKNVAVTSPVLNTSLKVSAPVAISATADDDDGNITSVEFRVNNQIVGTLTSYPYYLTWTPTNLGTYFITVKATDNDGNTVISQSVKVTVTDSGPNGTSVAVTSPASGAIFTAGTPTTLKANATDDVSIASVQFFVNGQPLGTPVTSLPYNIAWTPVAAGAYTIIARATDNVGNQATSATVNVTVNPNASPTVALTSPQATTVVAGTAISLAATASDVDGTITGVKFFANNVLVGSASAAPYTATWTPGAAGSYTVLAQATDDSGNVTSSTSVILTVSANQPPVVAITAPANGNVFRIGTGTTITASASDADGTVTSVQIVANGVILATLTSAPFTTTWNPATEGVYRLTAVATDNTGASTTSAPVTVMASLATAGSSDTIYAGTYAALGEFGNFTAINLHGRTATFIGYVPESQTQSPAKTYFYANMPIDASGGFILRDASNKVLISGTFSDTGVSGTFDNGRVTFVGPITSANSATPVAAGFYSGSILGHYSSVLTGIVGLDGSITLYLQDGTFTDSGAGSVDATGAFAISTRAGNKFVGKADPVTGFLSGTLSGAAGGSFAAALPSGNTFSDGFLRNISTRGFAGTGDKVLIAGFVVTGDVPKQILVRAIGPSLQGGLTGLLPDPQLQLFHGATAVPGSYNNDWAPGLSSTFSQVGAQPLTNGSKDAAVLLTLNPGVYSAMVSDVNGASGLALVELYDVDNQAAFSSQKMVNISTRGQVGTGDNVLIAGFVVNGTSPKKVLVRGLGPALAPSLPGLTLADPIVRIVFMAGAAGVPAGTVIRENDNWEIGNDPTLVIDANNRTGAQPLVSGSKDAVILMTLPPGIYSAQLSGAASGTGIGLIEVYEVQ